MISLMIFLIISLLSKNISLFQFDNVPLILGKDDGLIFKLPSKKEGVVAWKDQVTGNVDYGPRKKRKNPRNRDSVKRKKMEKRLLREEMVSLFLLCKLSSNFIIINLIY